MGAGFAGPGGLGGAGGSGGDDDDDEGPEGDENDGGENWYAGGERRYVLHFRLLSSQCYILDSGISIENPDRGARSGNNVVRDILRKAAEYVSKSLIRFLALLHLSLPSRAGQAPQAPQAPSGPFSGPAYTLGSDESGSSYIPDPNAPQGTYSILLTGGFWTSRTHTPHPGAPGELGDDQEVATRHITFWREGFSVEDGPLMKYDDPANSQLLDEINTGYVAFIFPL